MRSPITSGDGDAPGGASSARTRCARPASWIGTSASGRNPLSLGHTSTRIVDSVSSSAIRYDNDEGARTGTVPPPHASTTRDHAIAAVVIVERLAGIARNAV